MGKGYEQTIEGGEYKWKKKKKVLNIITKEMQIKNRELHTYLAKINMSDCFKCRFVQPL